jgi:hypothetical protein
VELGVELSCLDRGDLIPVVSRFPVNLGQGGECGEVGPGDPADESRDVVYDLTR